MNVNSSTSVSRVEYFERAQLLLVEFTSGAVYSYFDVPPEVYGAFEFANDNDVSVGKIFGMLVRNIFDYEELA